MREVEVVTGGIKSREEALASVTQAGNRTLEALKGHLSPEDRTFDEKLLENLNGARAWFSRNGLKMTSSLALAATFLTSCAPAVVAPIIPDGGGTKPTATEVSPTIATTPTETVTPTPEPTKTPEAVTFPICKEPEKVMDCYIPPEAAIDGSYVAYLKTQEWPLFDESKLKFRKLVRYQNPAYDEIRYTMKTLPNYPVPETRPYQRLTFGWTEYGGGKYVVAGTQYYVKDMEPRNYPWVIGLIYVDTSDRANADKIQKTALTYINGMNYPVYPDTNRFIAGWDLTPYIDTLVDKTFQMYPDLQQRIDRFIAGDPTALDGIALASYSENGGKFDR